MKTLLSGRVSSLLLCSILVAALFALGVRDEVPLGGLQGVAFMAENSKPLPKATVVLRPKFQLADWYAQNKVLQTRADGSFTFRDVPAGIYTLEAYSKAHSMKETVIAVEEGKVVPVNLELQPNTPRLRLNMSQHVFAPDETASANVEGFGFDDTISITAYRINLARIESGGGLETVLSSSFTRNQVMDVSNRKVFIPNQTFETRITRRDAEGSFVEEVNLPKLSKGVYWLSTKSSNQKAGSWLMVTDMAVILKKSEKRLLCYVTNIQTGEPIAGAKISLRQQDYTKELGVSDAQGLLSFPEPKDIEHDQTVLVASYGDSTAFVSYYDNEPERADIGIRTFIYTDRPIYRPGDEVQYKGVVRRLVGADYQLPGGINANIEIRDPDDNVIKSERITTSKSGTFSSSFKLNEEALTGAYSIVCRIGSAVETTYVQIASYRKPEFSVTVKSDRPFFVRGDKASATIEAQYYFGGPVVGANIEASVYRSPLWEEYSMELGDEEGAGAEDGGGELVKTIKAVTDGSGRANIQFDTEGKGVDPESDYTYNVSASVNDASGKYYSADGDVKVMRGEFRLSLDASQYILKPGEGADFIAIVRGNDDQKPVADVVVQIDYGYESWNGNRQAFAKLGTQTVRTNADGKAQLRVIAPNAGEFVAVAVARDRRGNAIRSKQYIYVSDESGYGFSERTGKISVLLDKKQYKVGDTARLLVSAKDAAGMALVTVEGDEVLDSRLVRVSKGSAMYTLPVKAAYAPNVYVSVAFVSRKTYFEASVRLGVDLSTKILRIALTPDRGVYMPRDTANYKISTTDAAGNPVSAEVSLGVVDESIYAIKEDDQDIVSAFYPKRARNVQTFYSFPEIFLGDGDKDQVNVAIRERFLDTAYWAATVTTDASGNASVRVPLPDNLTTWRATAIGVTPDTRVGKAVSKITVRKPLMVRLETPRFFTQKDESWVTAVINNNTGSTQDVRVSLQASGIEVVGGEQSVNVGSSAPEKVQWLISAPNAGNAVITVTARAGGAASDGMRLTIPIVPYGRVVTDSKTGDVRSNDSLRFTVHNGYVSGTGQLKINLTPSIAASMLDSLEYLAGYPYGCTEQTMSRFLPSVIVSTTLRDLGMSNPKLQAELPDMIAKGFARLRSYQHSDGGWGWWEYDQSEDWMTAYVLEGYYRAKQAGYEPPAGSLSQAIGWAKTRINGITNEQKQILPAADTLELLKSLALNGETVFVSQKIADIAPQSFQRSKELIPLLQIYDALGAKYQAYRNDALKRLLALANIGSSRASWTEEWYGAETTAKAILAIATVDPKNSVLPKAIRWLILQRQGDRWFSTRDTAFALLAIAKYMKANNEVQPSYALTVKLNGQDYKTIRINSQTKREDLKLSIPFQDLRAGDNDIKFQIDGKGNCYYSAEMKQVVDRGTLGESLTSGDLRLERRYYLLESRRLEDGTLRLLPSKDEVTSVAAGDLIRVVLKIRGASDREFMMLEDPIPSGCEITVRDQPDVGEDWENWWSRTDIRDNRVVFFARRLTRGTKVIEYTMRAETPGRIRAMPATLSNMYDPDVRVSTGERTLEIKR